MLSEDEIVERIKEFFGVDLLEFNVPRARRVFVRIRSGALRDAVSFLSRELNIKHLSTITGVDLGEEIELIYHFAYRGSIEISLRLTVPKSNPKIASIISLIPGAAIYEREVHDLLGVVFKGNPDLSRLILPEEWPEGLYPLRKENSPEEMRRITQGGEGGV